MDFAAWAARPRLAHFPEVVLLFAGMHAFGREDFQPQLASFVVRLQAFGGIALEVSSVQPIRLQPPAIDQQLPGPLDCFGFEVIAERPIAEHLKKRVVIRIVPDVVEVVVLAAGTDALLRIRCSRVLALARAQKHVLELVHPRIGEQQRRVVIGHDQRRGHKRVAFLLEEINELLANLAGSHNP